LVRLLICSCANIFFRIRVVGRENLPKSGGALIVANHVSYADAIIISSASPRFIQFLMWQPIYENKWLKPVCRLFDAIPLATHAPKEALRALRRARTEIQKGNLVGIFPEGELTKTSHVQPFERGVELIMRGLESTSVIPIYLDGLWGHGLSLKGGRPFGASRLRFRHEVRDWFAEYQATSAGAEKIEKRVEIALFQMRASLERSVGHERLERGLLVRSFHNLGDRVDPQLVARFY
jgi:acyl-[acyl-carrier-protein]-phospholipid O-acyltransferase/long-chain-fatty-acid--[acyl-carrier-protein] ligase